MQLGTQRRHSSAPLEARLPPSSLWHMVYSASTSLLSVLGIRRALGTQTTHKLVEKAAWEGTGLVSVGSAKIRAHQSRQPLFEKKGMGRKLRPCTRDPDMGPKAGSPRTVLC